MKPEDGYLHWELELIVDLRHQKVVAEGLPHFHDTDNGCVNLVLPVLEDPLSSAGLFLHLWEAQSSTMRPSVITLTSNRRLNSEL